jgi:hypothetical protein
MSLLESGHFQGMIVHAVCMHVDACCRASEMNLRELRKHHVRSFSYMLL